MKYLKKFTVKEWKKFNKPVQADNSLKFRNHFTGEMESYDYWTLQEVLLSKYKIILTDHVNKRGVSVMCPTPLKEKMEMGIKTLPSKITQENFDKGMKKFDEGMSKFNKAVQMFSSGLGDGKGSSKRDSQNLSKIVGKSKNTTKVWSDKPKRKTKRRSDMWDQNEKNLEKFWGKKK